MQIVEKQQREGVEGQMKQAAKRKEAPAGEKGNVWVFIMKRSLLIACSALYKFSRDQ